MTKFKVGDIVNINPESDYYGREDQLPIGVKGRVEYVGRNLIFPYTVSWNDGWNCYGNEDLLLAESFEGNE